MDVWLNYHHLLYFHRVARAGSLTAAARELRLTHSTLSVQIKELGERLGGSLFERRGRRLVLTPRGEQVLGYADEIFRLGHELVDVAAGRQDARDRTVARVGVAPGLPRTLAYELLEPALREHPGPLSLRVDNVPRLLEELSVGRLHVVLADLPPVDGARGKTFVHALGGSGIALYAPRKLAPRLRARFPASLDGAPMVLPAPGTGLRRVIERWLGARGIRPVVTAEADDAALLRVLGVRGHGVFPVRLALRAEVDDVPGVERVGALDDVEETYYAISPERRVRHPFVAALVQQARDALESTPSHEARRARRGRS
ncbi:MAG: transcriptional activator NhaR [Sandaracinaceae bacterium]